MFAYIVRRILATIPVMVVVALFVFALLHVSPGDPAAIIAGDTATPTDIARIRTQLGLDQPLYVQFGDWVWRLLHGDLGISIFTNLPVSKLIAQRVEPTIALTISTLLVSVLAAVPMGVLAAWKAGSWIDRVVMLFAVLGFSVPVFVLAYILIYIFAIGTELLPVEGYVSIRDGLAPFLSHIVLPSMPIATIIGIGVALLISGVVVTETVFAIPGIGRLTVDAILRRDYPVIQGIILIFSAAYVLVNLLVDLSYTLLDPRIRY
jgi:peptide/nickel transport system permease protein